VQKKLLELSHLVNSSKQIKRRGFADNVHFPVQWRELQRCKRFLYQAKQSHLEDVSSWWAKAGLEREWRKELEEQMAELRALRQGDLSALKALRKKTAE
jgi:hypothetical protein